MMEMSNRTAKLRDVVTYRNAAGETTDVVVSGIQGNAPAAGDFTVTPSAAGGTLATATYSYKVAVVVNGITSPAVAAAKTGAVTGPTGSVTINFTVGLASFPTATAWKVYGRVGGTELLIATITAPTATYVDTGAVTPAGALPTATNAIRFRNRGTKVTQVDVPKATTTKQASAYFNK
jgi:hypothetical protein